MRETHVREVVAKIRQEIVARSAESRAMHAQARALRGEERHRNQMERRAFGRRTRWLLLAYAWIRARPYVRAEPRAVVPVEVFAVKRSLEPLGFEADAGDIERWLHGKSPGFQGAVPGGEGQSAGAAEGGAWAASSIS